MKIDDLETKDMVIDDFSILQNEMEKVKEERDEEGARNGT